GAPCRFSTKDGKRTFADDCTILRKVAIGSEDGNYKMFSRANLKGIEGDLVSQKYNSGIMEIYFQDWQGQISLQPDSPPQFEMHKGEHRETGVVAMEEYWEPNTDIPQ